MLTKTYTISCDVEGCPASVSCSTTNRIDGPGEVRKRAGEAGWDRVQFGEDRCPDHREPTAGEMLRETAL